MDLQNRVSIVCSLHCESSVVSLILALEEFKKSKSGPWPKKVVHHWFTPTVLRMYVSFINYVAYNIYISLSVALIEIGTKVVNNKYRIEVFPLETLYSG